MRLLPFDAHHFAVVTQKLSSLETIQYLNLLITYWDRRGDLPPELEATWRPLLCIQTSSMHAKPVCIDPWCIDAKTGKLRNQMLDEKLAIEQKIKAKVQKAARTRWAKKSSVCIDASRMHTKLCTDASRMHAKPMQKSAKQQKISEIRREAAMCRWRKREFCIDASCMDANADRIKNARAQRVFIKGNDAYQGSVIPLSPKPQNAKTHTGDVSPVPPQGKSSPPAWQKVTEGQHHFRQRHAARVVRPVKLPQRAAPAAREDGNGHPKPPERTTASQDGGKGHSTEQSNRPFDPDQLDPRYDWAQKAVFRYWHEFRCCRGKTPCKAQQNEGCGNCPWGDVEEKKLRELLRSHRGLTLEQMEKCLWHLFQSDDVSPGVRPAKWIGDVMSYYDGVHDRYGRLKVESAIQREASAGKAKEY